MFIFSNVFLYHSSPYRVHSAVSLISFASVSCMYRTARTSLFHKKVFTLYGTTVNVKSQMKEDEDMNRCFSPLIIL